MPSAYNSHTPTGAINSYGGATAPSGWLICDGSVVSRTTYAALFLAVGTAFGSGDGSTTFALPDLRGRFVRGSDNMGTGAAGRDVDGRSAMAGGGNSGVVVGSIQGHAIQSHYHMTPFDKSNTTGSFGQAAVNTDSGLGLTISYAGNINFPSGPLNTTGNNSGNQGSETRPINANANYIIKY